MRNVRSVTSRPIPAMAVALLLALPDGATAGDGRPDGGLAARAHDATIGAMPAVGFQEAPGAGDSVGAVADTVADLVERARDHDERGDHAGAAEEYLAAAERAPEAATWLRLSALQALSRAADTAAARRLAGRLADEPVVSADSVRLEEARAAFEAGDSDRGAALARELSGAADPVFWTERVAPALLSAGDTARARRGLIRAASAPGAPEAAGELLLRLDPGWRDVERVARADLDAGRPTRGRRLLARTLEEAPVEARPELAEELAEAEGRAGRHGEAHGVATGWLRRGGLTAEARARLELVAARSHLSRGQREEAEVHYRRGARAGLGESSARAAYLLANLAHGRGETAAARTRYREAAERFPGTDHGGQARMRLGFLAFLEGDHDEAGAHFRVYRDAQPGGGWATASMYWEARARSAVGDDPGARRLFREVVRRDPLSWYGVRAGSRLGMDAVVAAVAGDASSEPSPFGAGRPATSGHDGGAAVPPASEELDPEAEALIRRMRLLGRLGWRGRALRELEHAGSADAAPGRLTTLAGRLGREGWTGPGIRLGWLAFQRGGGRWSPELIRAVWPLPHDRAVVRAAEGRDLSAALVAGLVRQESGFDPMAVSPAGAVGLMQLLPSTARRLARRSGIELTTSEDLKEPVVNLELGTRYLMDLLERFDGSRVGALAGYNAGPERWDRWRAFPEASVDGELLVERIPFAETRRYVKAVLRNAHLYARVYGLVDDPRAAELGS